MKKIKYFQNNLFFCAGLLLVNPSFSQAVDKVTESKITQLVYDELSKKNFLKHNRVTTEGKLSICELEFQYAYRDFRAKKGDLINVVGAFSSMYNGEKIPGYSLKVSPYQMDVRSDEKWKALEPAYINFKSNKIDFSKYKKIEFTCENGGKCAGYFDSDLKLNLNIVQDKSFEPEIFFSLNKGGYDNHLKLSTLMPTNEARSTIEKFRACHEEILIMFATDLNETNKNK